MLTRLSIRSVAATFLATAVVAGCSAPAPAPAAPPSPVAAASSGSQVEASAAAGSPIPATGFSLRAPAGYVDVTERAAKAILGWPLFADGTLTLVWAGVDPSDPGDLSTALVVGVLAGGPDPATAARTLAAGAGAGSGGTSVVSVAGQAWYTFPLAAGTRDGQGLGALCRFSETNVVVAEAGSGTGTDAHPRLWSVAASLGRA